MATKALLVGAIIVGSLFGGAAAQAGNVGPKRYAPGPASPSLSKLVAATGGTAANAADARYAYLRKLDSQLQVLATNRLQGASVARAAGQQGVTIAPSGSVLVDVYSDGNLDAAAAALTDVGMRVTAIGRHKPERMVEGWLPAAALTKAAGLGEARALAAVPSDGVNTGGTLSQGDAAHHGPAARALGPNGAGVKVGVISDSINRVGGGVAGSQASGDLPAGVSVLMDGTVGSSDEGRAMAEIIYDTAPGVSNMYFTTGQGAATRASGIANLVASGVKVIADDTFQINEPFFQDGVVAQAVDAAKAAGVTYLVSAGNRARQSWEGNFTPSGPNNDFAPGAAVDTVQTIGTFTDRDVFLALQWDEPFGGATTDLALDIYQIVGGVPTLVPSVSVNTDNIATGLPREFTSFHITGTATIGIGIRRIAGARNPFMKYILGGVPGGSVVAEYATNSGAIDPDASSARGALTVAASNFATPAHPEAFSSRGPARKLFNAAGVRLATPDVRFKPDLAAADGVATSVTGFSAFFGTSAAAPSAAGVAALVRSARPALSVGQVAAIMTGSTNTIDCTTAPGKPDLDCGYGFILADRAVTSALDVTPPAIVALLNPATPNGKNGWYTSNVSVAWSAADPQSPLFAASGCGPVTINTNGTRTLTCTAASIGGTASRSVTIKRDSTRPSKPKFKGIKAKSYKRSKLPKRSKVKCKSSDATSGIKSCKVKGYSKRLGKHKLRATATNRAGLTSKRTLTYKVVH